MRAAFNIDYSQWQKSSRDMASLATKREPQDILKSHMKALLKSILGITPPSQMSGGTFTSRMPNSDDKARGEQAIESDLKRIFEPLGEAQLSQIVDFQGRRAEFQYGHKGAAALGTIVEEVLTLGQMKEWHQSRRRSDGRVMQINRDVTTGHRKRDLRGLDKGLVSNADFQSYLQQVCALVGWLAAGWNPAAQMLGLHMPPWIARHGTKHGGVRLIVAKDYVQLTILNDVPFIDDVEGLKRRVQYALNYSANSLERQYEAALRRLASRAFH